MASRSHYAGDSTKKRPLDAEGQAVVWCRCEAARQWCHANRRSVKPRVVLLRRLPALPPPRRRLPVAQHAGANASYDATGTLHRVPPEVRGCAVNPWLVAGLFAAVAALLWWERWREVDADVQSFFDAEAALAIHDTFYPPSHWQ